MSSGTTPSRDALDDKVNRVFAGRVVRKDLVRKVKVGANVPVFVLEFLLGKYWASSDELSIQMGLQVVNDTLANNYIRADGIEVGLGHRRAGAADEEGQYPSPQSGRSLTLPRRPDAPEALPRSRADRCCCRC